jgi:hypothetical protein
MRWPGFWPQTKESDEDEVEALTQSYAKMPLEVLPQKGVEKSKTSFFERIYRIGSVIGDR